jgi:uncharacterized protein YbaA (DUF1428 family)
MYIAGFVIPVPERNMEAYRKWAENEAAIFREYGCIEIVDSWEDNVPSGKLRWPPNWTIPRHIVDLWWSWRGSERSDYDAQDL